MPKQVYTMRHYGPDLTTEIKLSLEGQIKSFDKEALRRLRHELENQLIDQPSKDTAAEEENKFSNPDLISDEETLSFSRPNLSQEYEEAKKDIDTILSHREKQVWRLVMRQGLTHAQAASLLHLQAGSIKTYLRRATEKVKRYVGNHD